MTKQGRKQKGVRRKVVSAELESGGNSIFVSHVTLGCVWSLKLECGHATLRRPRYINPGSVRVGWKRKRAPEDALPPPRYVWCTRCKKEQP